MTKSAPQYDQMMKEVTEFSTKYSDACTKSGSIFMKGLEDIMGTMVSIAQTSAEKQAEFMKEAMASKTVNEFAEVQSKIAQTSFDDFMSGATKISEISVKIITDSAEPVNAQIMKVAQKATKTAKAAA